MSEDDLLLRFFKALAGENRLRMLGILADQALSLVELSAMLRLRPAAVSHHLDTLAALGIVQARLEGGARVYRLNAEALRRMSRQVLPAHRTGPTFGDEGGDARAQKVLRDFLEGERLQEIPAGRARRLVILAWLAERFEPGTRSAEAVVNERLKRHHPDFAALRRLLVDEGFLARQAGIYWRVAVADRSGLPE